MPPKKRRNISLGIENIMPENEPETSNTARESSEDELDGFEGMDLAQCETRRAELLNEMQNLECQFNVLREQLFNERKQQLENRMAALRNETTAESIAELTLLELEKQSRIEIAGILKEEKLEMIHNRYDAEKVAARQDFESDKKLTYDNIHNELVDNINQLEADKKKTKTTRGKGIKRRARKKTKQTRKKAVVKTVSGPYIVYMLKPEDIMEDWTTIKKASQMN